MLLGKTGSEVGAVSRCFPVNEGCVFGGPCEASMGGLLYAVPQCDVSSEYDSGADVDGSGVGAVDVSQLVLPNLVSSESVVWSPSLSSPDVSEKCREGTTLRSSSGTVFHDTG